MKKGKDLLMLGKKLIDFFKDSADLTDLDLSVSVNGTRKTLSTDYTIETGTKNKWNRGRQEWIRR